MFCKFPPFSAARPISLSPPRDRRAINVKKGQFLAPWDMVHVAGKIASAGNDRVLLCERGSASATTLSSRTCARYRFSRDRLSRGVRRHPFCPQPGGQGGKSGGERQFVEILARAAVAVGVAAVFMETHQDPDRAPSDGPNMVPLACAAGDPGKPDRLRPARQGEAGGCDAKSPLPRD